MSGVTLLWTAPTTTSWPRSLRRRPSSNMRNDLPDARGVAQKHFQPSAPLAPLIGLYAAQQLFGIGPTVDTAGHLPRVLASRNATQILPISASNACSGQCLTFSRPAVDLSDVLANGWRYQVLPGLAADNSIAHIGGGDVVEIARERQGADGVTKLGRGRVVA